MKKWVLFLMMLLGAGRVDARPYMPEFALDASCPKEKPFGYYGDCVGCDDYRFLDIKEGHEKDFEICSNRETINEGELPARSILKKCPVEAPMRNHIGSCVSCDYSHFLWATKEECQKCPNRVSSVDEVWSENYCELKECPSDAPLKDNHECLSCDSKGLILSVDQEMCQRCSETYEWYRGKCVPVVAAKVFDDDTLIDLEYWVMLDESHFDMYITHDCHVTDAILTTKRNCQQCPNREYKNGRCVLRQDIEQKSTHPGNRGGLVMPVKWDDEIQNK